MITGTRALSGTSRRTLIQQILLKTIAYNNLWGQELVLSDEVSYVARLQLIHLSNDCGATESSAATTPMYFCISNLE